jgi:predicted transcriptional regulator
MSDDANPSDLLTHTAQILAAHLRNNTVPVAEVPALMRIVHKTLEEISGGPPADASPQPAVPIRRSVTPDFIVCLEDGKKLKMLKRHLRTAYNLSPEDYRIRWGLAPDYPMVAPNYARQRSTLAKKIGLGKRRPG